MHCIPYLLIHHSATGYRLICVATTPEIPNTSKIQVLLDHATGCVKDMNMGPVWGEMQVHMVSSIYQI